MYNICPLIIAESALLLWVLVVLPIYAVRKSRKEQSAELKGLALPQGTVRSMLALAIVGSFVVFLVFGGFAFENSTRFTEVVAA